MDKIHALLNKSQQYLRSAALLLETGDADSCVSRAYFAMFYAAQAALLSEHQSIKGRQGVRSSFVEYFVESGRFPSRAGEVINRGYEMQETADYAQHPAVSDDDAERTLQEAEAFVNSIENLVERRVRV